MRLPPKLRLPFKIWLLNCFRLPYEFTLLHKMRLPHMRRLPPQMRLPQNLWLPHKMGCLTRQGSFATWGCLIIQHTTEIWNLGFFKSCWDSLCSSRGLRNHKEQDSVPVEPYGTISVSGEHLPSPSQVLFIESFLSCFRLWLWTNQYIMIYYPFIYITNIYFCSLWICEFDENIFNLCFKLFIWFFGLNSRKWIRQCVVVGAFFSLTCWKKSSFIGYFLQPQHTVEFTGGN